ncbi:MAG: methyltransferase [Thermodesulfobacteriota bacterium]
MAATWTIGELLGTSSAYWRGCALQAGVRLGLFSSIAAGFTTGEQISENLNTDPRATGLLLDGLTGMGLLIKEDGSYVNSVAADDFLVKQSTNYIGHIILHHHHLVDGWAQLDQAVRTGQPVDKRSYGEDVERESFLMGMFNLAMANGPKVAAEVDLSGRTRLLDLGGGPGTYAIHFCLKNPTLSAVIFDRSTTEPFARSTVEKFGLTERIDFNSGDFTTDDLSGGPYDAAWLSHILHSSGEEMCQQIIDKTVAAMEPGGLILIHDFILENDKSGPEFPALFGLNMLLNNPAGRSYSESEIIEMLCQAGAKEVQRHPWKGPNDSGIICATV